MGFEGFHYKTGSRRIWLRVTISIFFGITFFTLLMSNGIKGVESHGYDDYGGMNPFGGGYDGGLDQPPDSPRDEMMDDIMDQRRGYPNELSTRNKKFKLFEKRTLTYEKAKTFCKKRDGQLAQALNVDEMQRLQTLLMKGTSLSTNVWIGADKREWKKHSSKMLGKNRPNLGPNAMLMGGGPTTMCPAMSISTRSLAPVECYKPFPFICEFPPGKGKAPLNTGKEKKKNKKKDEMRRKREILQLSPTNDVPMSSSSPSYDTYSTVLISTTTAVYNNRISRIKNQKNEAIAESRPTATDDIDKYEREHKTTFHPRIVFSSIESKNGRLSSTMTSFDSPTSASNVNRQSDDEINKRKEVDHYLTADMSTERNFERAKGLVSTASIGVEDLDVVNDRKKLDINPDQQLVNLFDEQLANMRLIEPEQPLGYRFQMRQGIGHFQTSNNKLLEATTSDQNKKTTDVIWSSRDPISPITVTESSSSSSSKTESSTSDNEAVHRSGEISNGSDISNAITTDPSFRNDFDSSSEAPKGDGAKSDRKTQSDLSHFERSASTTLPRQVTLRLLHNKSVNRFRDSEIRPEITFEEIRIHNRLVAG